MVRGQKPKQVLSESELKTLREERKEVQDTLNTVDGARGQEKYGEGTPAGNVDRAALNRQDKKLEQAIKDGSPTVLRGGQKDKAVSEAGELESHITDGMPTRDEMQRPLHHPGAVQKHMNWEKRNLHNILRWKQLKRQLNPGDPTTSSVENLRKP